MIKYVRHIGAIHRKVIQFLPKEILHTIEPAPQSKSANTESGHYDTINEPVPDKFFSDEHVGDGENPVLDDNQSKQTAE